MPLGSGYQSRMGAGKETTFGTAVVMTDLIPYSKESISESIAMIESNVLRGLAGRDMLDLGSISVAGSIETETRYTQKSGSFFCGNDLLLSLAMGKAPTYSSGVNTLFLDESPVTSVTIALDKKVAYWEFVSCMLKGFKLTAKAGEFLSAEINAIAYQLLRSGTTNGATQFSNLTATGGKRVLFGDLTFRLNAIASGALASTDAIGLTDFVFDYDANLTEPQFSSPDASVTVGAGTHSNARLTRKPVRNGFRTCKINFSLARYETAGGSNWGTALETWKAAGTELQMDVSASIDTAARTFKLLMPRLKIESVDAPVDGAGVMTQKVTATLLFNGGTSSGGGVNAVMTNSVPSTNKIPEEFQLEFKNSTDGRIAAIWS